MTLEELEKKMKEEICGLKARIVDLEKEKQTTTVVHNHYHTNPPSYTFPTPPVMGKTVITGCF